MKIKRSPLLYSKFSLSFHSTFPDLSSKKSVEIWCLDCVLHMYLISLVSLNSFEIHVEVAYEIRVEVAFLRMRFLLV